MFNRYPIKIYDEKDAFEYTYSTVRVFVMYYDVNMQIPMIKTFTYDKNIANRQDGTAGVLVINKCSGLNSLRRDKRFYYFIKRVFRRTFYRTLTSEYHYLYGIVHRLEDFALYRKKRYLEKEPCREYETENCLDAIINYSGYLTADSGWMDRPNRFLVVTLIVGKRPHEPSSPAYIRT